MDALLKEWGDADERVEPVVLKELASRVRGNLPRRYVEILEVFGPPYFEKGDKAFTVDWSRFDGKKLRHDEQALFPEDYAISVFSSPPRLTEMLDHIEFCSSFEAPCLPRPFFPFATDVFSMMLLFDLSPERHGQIYAWQPVPEPWGEGENQYIGFVADSLDDFLFNRLRDESTDDFVPGA